MRRTLPYVGVVIGLCGCFAAGPVVAHHSFGTQFDSAQPVLLTGEVARVEWVNPHVYVYVNVLDEPAAGLTQWVIELGSPNALRRLGWRPDTVTPGDVLTVEGYRARRQDAFAGATSIVSSKTGARLRVLSVDPGP